MSSPERYLPTLLVLLLTTHGLAESSTVITCDVDDPTECPIAQVCAPTSTSGVCATPPISGAVLTTNRRNFPVPTAYFPLTGQSVDSWPERRFTGRVKGAVWQQDREFGSVLHCKEGLSDVVQLENIEIGERGPFTVNLWMKKSPTSNFFGAAHQFLFSVGVRELQTVENFDPSLRNQIHLFLPENSNAAHGLIRVIVKDDDDSEDEIFYLDSDGLNNTDTRRNESLPHVELADGQWHMITVSSVPSGRDGFRIFVDGEMVAETTRSGNSPGGGEMKMDGEIHLCGRIDGEPNRHFDGSLSKLSIYDEALKKSQIQSLYLAVRESTLSRQIRDSVEVQEWNEKTNATLYVDSRQSIRYVRGPEVDFALIGRTDEVDPSLTPTQFNLLNFAQEATLCPTNPEAFGLNATDFCRRTEICTPVHGETLLLLHELSNFTSEEGFGLTGICAQLPNGEEGVSFAVGIDSGLPPPLAYFPLSNGQLETWPVPNAQGIAVATEMREDEIFGEVFECQQENRSFVILDNVAYGENGPFAINLWFKASDLSGDRFQYLFSHSSVFPALQRWSANQIQLYLGENNHSSEGIVRAIVKDTSDELLGTPGVIFLDSDGDVALMERKEKNRIESQLVNISDNQWHMLTLSTRLDFRKGYVMFLDGLKVGEVREDLIYTGDDGIVRPASGGDPMRPGGKIYLCGRYDGIPTRHFSGSITEVMLFDQPLSEDQVGNLYGSAVRSHPDLISGRRRLLQAPSVGQESPSSWQGALNEVPGSMYGPCMDSGECEGGLSCVPVLASGDNGEFMRSGVCVEFPSSGAYVFDSDSDIEIPVAYFPLTNQSLSSWPLPTFFGSSTSSLTFIEDEVFGSVLDCSEQTEDKIVLDNVPYSLQSGEFTLALWIRQHPHHTNDSSDFGFEFVFSHVGDEEDYTGLLDQNQVQVFIPRSDPALAGRIRAVVRDEDDRGEDLVYLDSSQSSKVDLNDGKWHMLAISSRSGGRKGFRMYLDGELAAEMKGSGATGGNSITLSSGIHLCGRADGVNGTHFDGNLAHLILWDQSLTQTELFALYERFILAAEDVRIEHPTRQTITGESCFFPALLRGEVVVDCTPLDEVLKCPVRNGSWVECRPFEEANTLEMNSSMVRVTIDGEECPMPGFLNNREVYGCVDFNGVFACEIRPGQWKECSPLLELRYTTEGLPCVFPFTYEGREYSDCVPISVQEEICQVENGEFQTCASTVYREEINEEISSPMMEQGEVLVEEVISRVSQNGDVCSFPFWFDGKSVGSCVEIEGLQMCQSRNGTMEVCSAITYTEAGTPCVFPFPFNSTLSNSCIDREDKPQCRVSDGSFMVCADSDENQSMTQPLALLPGRVTMGNESCSFPFWYEDKLVSDCVGEEVERCLTNSGNFEECKPKQMTIVGESCSFPFEFEQVLHFACIELEGIEQCRLSNGSFAPCENEISSRNQSIERFTIQGIPCRFPFDYDGEKMEDCVVIDNEEHCKVEDGDEWAVCAPLVETRVFQRQTTNEEDCSIPFVYGNHLYTNCFREEDGREVCKTEDEEGPLEECVPTERGAKGRMELVQYPFERNTTEGLTCHFPFHYQDELWIDCVEFDGIESCRVWNGSWQECVPRESQREETETIRYTTDGDECVFPLNYNGEEHFDCVEIDGTEQCKDEDGVWEECVPLEASTEGQRTQITRYTIDGDECVFPLNYNGEEHFDCVEIDGTEQCKDDNGFWEECVAPGDARPLVTLSNEEEDESETDDGGSSSMSAGGVIGIIIAVLIGILIIVGIVGFAVYKYGQYTDKHVETSRSHFARYQGGGEDIAMAAISSKNPTRAARMPASDEVPF